MTDSPTMTEILIERPDHGAAVEALFDEVFGPGRFAKTAERLREGNQRLQNCSFVAFKPDGFAGAVRQWPIDIGGAPAVLLGPIAIAPRWKDNGVGAKLMQSAIDSARENGHSGILLVGDLAYYGRFGFACEPHRFTLPGPVDPLRVLFLPLHARFLPLRGALKRPDSSINAAMDRPLRA